MPQTLTSKKGAIRKEPPKESLAGLEPWEREFIKKFGSKAVGKNKRIQDEQERLLRLLKKQEIITGFFYARRLLEQLGKQVDSKKIIEILNISGIEVDRQQIEELVGEYHEKQAHFQTQKSYEDGLAYTAEDGMRLIVRGKDGYFEADLEIDLETGGNEQTLENLIKRLQIITEVSNKNVQYVQDQKGEDKTLVAKLTLRGVKKIGDREQELLEKEKLYQELLQTLQKRIIEVGKEKRGDPKSLIDDIYFFTHIGFEKLYERILKLTEVTYFLKEIYGVIEAKTGVTRKQIISDKKSREISDNRHALMYIMRHRFPCLTSTNLGIIFGEPGKQKNHATALLAQGLFEEDVGLPPEKYRDRRLGAPKLYDDAMKKHEAYKTAQLQKI